MNVVNAKVSDIKTNPNNPRLIKDDKFKKLVKSIKDFPEMLRLRPIVVNSDMVVLGGNMRLKACKEAGLKEVPIIRADELTEDQQREFIIKDNVGFGEWEWDMIRADWDVNELSEWGLDIPEFETKEQEIDLSQFNKSAESYLNNTIRQIVLQYDLETHKYILSQLQQICEVNSYDKDNSTAVLKLIEDYASNRD
jgi:hypothetical protein